MVTGTGEGFAAHIFLTLRKRKLYMTLESLTNGLKPFEGNVDAVWRRNNAFALNAQGRLIALSISGKDDLTLLEIGSEASELEYLYLAGNKNLKKIIFKAPLPKLAHLNVSECTLETPLHLPAGCEVLKQVYFRQNNLSQVVFQGNYPALQLIDLSENRLERFELPMGAANLEYLYLQKNPSIAAPPAEIAKQGSEAVLNWYGANKKVFKEIKVLLVGEPKAGKTSVLKRVKYNTYNPNEGQTDGIIIEEFEFDHLSTFSQSKNLHGIKAYWWDFGGQDIMKATHEFFLTQRSLYLLILEARSDTNADDQVRKWMKRIKTFGGDSHVIVVANKIELNRAFGIDLYVLQKEFPQIVGFIKVSCDKGEGFDQLRDALEENIPKAKLCSSEIDERWIKIKESIQKVTSQKYYVPEDFFHETCVNNSLTDPEEQKEAITFLNDLGILLHFDQFSMRAYFVLDPYWVTLGVYRIITSEKAALQKGRIQVDQLDEIVNKEKRKLEEYRPPSERTIKYDSRELGYLADILTYFKLGYYSGLNKESILIPSLFDTATPAEEYERIFKSSDALRFNYKYEYLPESTLPQFMVDLNENVGIHWRSGVLLHSMDRQAEALVTAGNDKIQITVIGSHKQKRQFLSVIRNSLDKINGKHNVEVENCIPLPGYIEEFCADYQELIELETEGEEYYRERKIKDKAKQKFLISKLLDGIESEDKISQLRREMSQGFQTVHNHLDEIYFDLVELEQKSRQELIQLYELVDKNKFEDKDLEKMMETLQYLMISHLSYLPMEIKKTWNDLDVKTKEKGLEHDIKGKFKMKIPVIPFLIEYEAEFGELKVKFKEMWNKLKAGKVFLE